MRVYFIDLKHKNVIDYLAKDFYNFETSYQITHYDGGVSIFSKIEFNLFYIQGK